MHFTNSRAYQRHETNPVAHRLTQSIGMHQLRAGGLHAFRSVANSATLDVFRSALGQKQKITTRVGVVPCNPLNGHTGAGNLQTELQTNHAAQDGIRDYRATLPSQNWRTRAHD